MEDKKINIIVKGSKEQQIFDDIMAEFSGLMSNSIQYSETKGVWKGLHPQDVWSRILVCGKENAHAVYAGLSQEQLEDKDFDYAKIVNNVMNEYLRNLKGRMENGSYQRVADMIAKQFDRTDHKE